MYILTDQDEILCFSIDDYLSKLGKNKDVVIDKFKLIKRDTDSKGYLPTAIFYSRNDN